MFIVSAIQNVDVTEILAALLAVLLCILMRQRLKNPLRKIPGPAGWPLIGNVFSLEPKRLHMTLYKMAEEYGDVMKICVFNQSVVVINSAELILEALSKKDDDFQSRPPNIRAADLMKRNFSFVGTDHPDYPLLKNYAVRTFKSTMSTKSPETGNTQAEQILLDTISDVIDSVQEKDGQPIDTSRLSYGYLACVMVSLFFGEQYFVDDPIADNFRHVHKADMDVLDPTNKGALFDLLPFLYKFKFILPSTHAGIEKAIAKNSKLFDHRISEAKARFDEKDIRGILDRLIHIQKDDSSLDDSAITGIAMDMMGGGIESTFTATLQIFLHLLHFPQVQKQIQEEIDSQFEPVDSIYLKDRSKLPLLDSYIHESLRYLTKSPVLTPYLTRRDTQLGKHKIPAQTKVLMNVFYASHNPEIYEEPFTVRADRFLDANGKVVSPNHPLRKNSMGFGSGKRLCPGESFARKMIFMLLANLLHKFSIEAAEELPDHDVRSYNLKLMIYAPKVSALFQRRKH